jgi:hypothetical protein
MNPEWAISEQDLRWFFRDAAAACGARSTMGPLIDILRAGILPRGGSRELREAPDTLDGMIAEYEGEQKRLRAFGEARRIFQALEAIGERRARVLDLAYGCEHAVQNVSLSLACDCPSAIRGHHMAVLAARKLVTERRKLGRSHAGKRAGAAQILTPKRSARERHKASLPLDFTVRQWLLWLLAAAESAEDAPERALLGKVLSEATDALHDALGAFHEASRRAE